MTARKARARKNVGMSVQSASEQKTVVVTGASTGIGRATAIALHEAGWRVLGVARRREKLAELTAHTGIETLAADLTDQADVDRLAATCGPLDALVACAGGARGVDTVENGSIDDWRWMFEANVIGTKRLLTALLPKLRERSREIDGFTSIVGITSTAALQAYEGGGGYNAAKFAERAMFGALRLELAGEPIRVIDIAPGMVKTEEFSLRRLGGDANAAAKVYEGVEFPLTGEDVAATVCAALALPGHVNLDQITVRPVAQASQTKVIREHLRARDDA